MVLKTISIVIAHYFCFNLNISYSVSPSSFSCVLWAFKYPFQYTAHLFPFTMFLGLLFFHICKPFHIEIYCFKHISVDDGIFLRILNFTMFKCTNFYFVAYYTFIRVHILLNISKERKSKKHEYPK